MRIKVALVCVMLLLASLVSSCTFLPDNLSKKQIFALVSKNKDLLEKAVTEVEDKNIGFVSKTDKTPIYDEVYSALSGLYVKKRDDINCAFVYENITNDTLLSVLSLSGLKGISAANGIIEFSCGGSGFGPSTSYYGFYHTADENLTGIWCAGEEKLMPDGEGWSIIQRDGDNRYYTEHIAEHFYYYEAHF